MQLPFLYINDGAAATVIWEAPGSTAAQAVSTTCRYTWGAGVPTSGQVGATTNVKSVGALPEGLIVPPGGHIGITMVGKSAATDAGKMSFHYVKHTV